MADYLAEPAPVTTGPKATYGTLKKTHPEYDLKYWQELRALYAGGKELLKTPDVMERLFERIGNESIESWQRRMKLAFYVNHFGAVIDDIVGQLTDPLEMLPPGATPDDKDKIPDDWQKFFEDSSPPAGETTSFSDLMLDQTRAALVVGRMWTLVELPPAPEVEPSSALEQDAQGLRDHWACAVPTECVLNWELIGDGEFRWVKTCFTSRHQPNPLSEQVLIREEYTIYTADTWVRFVVEYDENQDRKVPEGEPEVKRKPKDEDTIEGTAGIHSFKRVPLVRKVLPPALWAGNKLHSIAVEYFNRSNAEAHGQKNIVGAQLYEFLAPEMEGVEGVVNEHQADPQRARRTPRGPDIVQVRGEKDKAAYIAPPSDGFEFVAKSLDDLKQEMYRVSFSMLNESNEAPALGRSAESKNIDHSANRRAANLVAEQTKDHAVEAVNVAAVGRNDDGFKAYGESTWTAQGMEAREEADAGALIEQAISLEMITIPSATYQKKRKARLAKADLGKEATPAVVKAIEEELDKAITQDSIMAMSTLAQAAPGDDDEGGFPVKRPSPAAPAPGAPKKKAAKPKA